jgi:hypothetical protein
MTMAGVSDVYSKSNDLLNAFLNINISESQVYRVTDYIGNQLIPDLMEEIDHPGLEEKQRVYASIDGSMIQMDQGWQEAKLGRIFCEDSRVENGTKGEGEIRYKLEESSYSGHLGSHIDFIPKFEASLGTYKNHEKKMVFITDGAVWIQRYLMQRFSESTHILDYFHAVEHLSDFSKLHFEESIKGRKWVKKQETELLEGSVQTVINNITKLRKLSPSIEKERGKLLEYYKNNLDRMNYKSFRSQGLMIGSGPMEAAHKTVIQTRMKRSGQRWTPDGAQAMLNLRVIRESNRWNCVSQLLMQAA